jgi:hypothetical protein
MRPHDLTEMIAAKVLLDGPTDLTIACRHGRRFEVHKSVVCPQSQVLARMCKIAMREERTGLIEHKQFDSDTVELMVQHAYAGQYAVTKRPVPLSLLERELEQDEVDQRTREAERKEAEKGEAIGKSGNEGGNEDDLSQDVESNTPSAAAAAAAIVTSADDATVTRPVSNLPNAPSPSIQNMAPPQNGETVRQQQQLGLHPLSQALDSYIPQSNQWLGIIDQLVTHVRLYGLADYYEMKTLREYSCNRFSKIVDQRVDLRPEHTMRSFIDVVREVGARTYPSDPCGLRGSFLKLIMEHATDLCTNRGFIKDLGDSGLSELAADMLQEVSECMLRDRYYHIDRRKNLMTLHKRLTEREDFWEGCAPGWKKGYR